MDFGFDQVPSQNVFSTPNALFIKLPADTEGLIQLIKACFSKLSRFPQNVNKNKVTTSQIFLSLAFFVHTEVHVTAQSLTK